MPAKTAVLLMAHGAPESLGDIPAYLGHIMKGRPPSEEVIEQIKDRYRLVGGKSPLLEITKQQALALEGLLNQDKNNYRVYIGMRHWHPFIDETIQKIASDQPDQLIAISLAPQYSKLSVGAYIQTLENARASTQLEIPVQAVKSWYDQVELIVAFAEKIQLGLAQYDAVTRPQVHLLFTAHSLPEEVVSQGDPYPIEIEKTVAAILKQLDLDSTEKNWSFAYQSQGFRGGRWLGPKVEDVINSLGEKGITDLLVVPIGFVSDHVEILYDVDILYKDLAASQGISLQRTASLNTSPRFIQALARIVQKNRLNSQ